MAMCPACKAPLICTMAFSKFEFYCLECGRRYGWLDPIPAIETPAITRRYEKLKAEWDEIAPALIGGGVRLKNCESCTTRDQPHWDHASGDEKAAHEAALETLRQRAAA